MKKAKLIIHDEINCIFKGLRSVDRKKVFKAINIFVEGARHTAGFQIGIWDGRDAHFDENTGATYVYMLDSILPILDDLGYELDFEDHRKEIPFTAETIDKHLFDYVGITLRDHQVEAANLTFEHEKGFIAVATSGGKSLICAAISKIYDPAYRTLIITNSEKLVNQTYDDYVKVGLDVGKNHGKVRDKKGNMSKRHVITTWQALANQRDCLKEFDVFLYDEAHIMGDIMFDILSNELANAHVRIGLTGTVPKKKKQPFKREALCCHIGGEELIKVKAHELQNEGHIATVDIKMYSVRQEINLPDEEWSTEYKYLTTNRHRIHTIAEFIDALPKKNTLILCHPEQAKKLSEILDINFIDQGTKSTAREKYYREFENHNDYRLAATYGTVGTGISIDEIEQMVLIDVGKNETRILQGIGRGLRLDGITNHCSVYDLYAETWKPDKISKKLTRYGFSSGTHLRERKRIYKVEKYPFKKIGELNVIT